MAPFPHCFTSVSVRDDQSGGTQTTATDLWEAIQASPLRARPERGLVEYAKVAKIAQTLSRRARTGKILQRSAKRRGCLISYSQAEPGRELTQPSPRLLAKPCMFGVLGSTPSLSAFDTEFTQPEAQLFCTSNVCAELKCKFLNFNYTGLG